MAYMLIVTTVELGNPVILFILVISNDRLFHGQPDSVADILQKPGAMRPWLAKNTSRPVSLKRVSTSLNFDQPILGSTSTKARQEPSLQSSSSRRSGIERRSSHYLRKTGPRESSR
jgi:hypothetical protein